jgi:putative glutamine amidotransferase
VYELMLCRAAIASRKPILGICRGMQLVNVACNGSLHQHLPDVVGDAIEHRSPLKGVKAAHDVEISAGTELERIAGRDTLWVNSFHHQGIDRLGEGLRASAFAADGVIEGVEGTGDGFLIGVQWHLESLTATEPRHGALLTALIQAAEERRGDRRKLPT